ncbi:MAG: hypothetical protein CVT49_13665 [candidate division Zixibacteria bacterium HGW-Zixibacteria-1]|nr:MAG: hypothetical protein CVT49_13665 [candidate division Zixibacteria bacterium HGW-Zixibacteria-1]
MKNLDRKAYLEREPYSYRVITDDKVFIYAETRLLTVLRNKEAENFLRKIIKLDGLKAQKFMAKIVEELVPSL